MARPAVTGQFVFVVMAFGCLVYSFVNDDFSVLYVAAQFQFAPAALLQGRRALGCTRGIAPAVDPDLVDLERGRRRVQPPAAGELFEPGDRHHGSDQRRLHVIHAVDFESVSAADPRGARTAPI